MSGIKKYIRKDSDVADRELPSIEFSKRPSKAQTFKGRLIGDLQKARNDLNYEMERYIWELFEFFNKCYPTKIVKYYLKMVDGWKKKDSIEIYRGFEEDFILVEHRKDKKTSNVDETAHKISKEHVNKLLFWIKGWKMGETKTCYDFAEYLGYPDWKDLWRERNEYFEVYYFPVKVLEALGLISYGGKGTITRIK